MAEKTHWPFGDDEAGAEAHRLELERKRELERHNARIAGALQRQQMRTNRLLVGGRAHVKKPGLS